MWGSKCRRPGPSTQGPKQGCPGPSLVVYSSLWTPPLPLSLIIAVSGPSAPSILGSGVYDGSGIASASSADRNTDRSGRLGPKSKHLSPNPGAIDGKWGKSLSHLRRKSTTKFGSALVILQLKQRGTRRTGKTTSKKPKRPLTVVDPEWYTPAHVRRHRICTPRTHE